MLQSIKFLMPLFSFFLRQSGRTGASELVQSVSLISNFLPLTNNSSKRFTLCARNNSPETSMLKIPLEKSIHPFLRPFVHASPPSPSFSTSNIHPSIHSLAFPSQPPSSPLLSIPLSIRPSMSPSVPPSVNPSVLLSVPLSLSGHSSVCPSVPLSVYLSVCLLICPSVPLPVRLSIHPSTNESLTNIFRLSLITYTIDFF